MYITEEGVGKVGMFRKNVHCNEIERHITHTRKGSSNYLYRDKHFKHMEQNTHMNKKKIVIITTQYIVSNNSPAPSQTLEEEKKKQRLEKTNEKINI